MNDKQTDPQATRLRELAPVDELNMLIMEATASIERELALEDAGWINFSAGTGDVVSDAERITNLKLSRLYYYKDPLAKQSIRLWTDYTFGTGMKWSVAEGNKDTKKALEAFWQAPANQSVLSARGQRKSSDKLLVDGEIFFAIFLGPNSSATLRAIDPLEITEIITDPDDKENVKFYRRQWTDAQGQPHNSIYRSTTNIKGEATPDRSGNSVAHTDEALIYHLTYNTIGQRGNPLLLPALDWIKQYRRFLASRIAIMLALARFAMKQKIMGGQAAVDAIKAKTHQKEVAAGSTIVENAGSDTTPIKTESGASAAKEDGRMIRLQVCAAVGIPEQYFGDISCYAEDTEALTENGWMLHKDWQAGVKIASYNPDNRQIEYIEPEELRTFDYQGDMIRFKGRGIDILVSPEHRMWVQDVPSNLGKGRPSSQWGEWHFAEAHSLLPKRTQRFRLKRAASLVSTEDNPISVIIPGSQWTCGRNTVRTTPDRQFKGKDWYKFLGWFISEGCVWKTKEGQYLIEIGQNEGSKADIIRKDILAVGLKASEKTSDVIHFTICDKPLAMWLEEQCLKGAHNKRLPDFVWQASQAEKMALWEGLRDGDGSIEPSGNSGYYSTASSQLADDVQRLLLELGYSTFIRSWIKPGHKPGYVVRFNKQQEQEMRTSQVSEVDYEGKVYCFALPKNHIYITRRNKTIAIQGNTGNLATAKTVELPLMKMFQSYQAIWSDAYQDIDEVVLAHAKVSPDKWYIDRDFPNIAPEDVALAAQAIVGILGVMPELGDSEDVKQIALMTMGVNDPAEVLEQLSKQAEANPSVALGRALKQFREVLKKKE